jgi:acetyltransferase-like isoleucine patch superfamily enzyme
LIENDVKIGDNVTIKSGVQVWDGITIEDNVQVGANVSFTNDRYPRAKNPNWVLERTTICKGASIGAGCTLLCGITIGENAMIGAGSVVTKDVPAFALMVGNPARRVGWVSRYGEKLKFDKQGVAICPATGEKYQLVNDLCQLVEE